MRIDEIVVLGLGVFGIVFVWWFFLGKKRKKVEISRGTVDITVDGGYQPEVISLPYGETTIINFTRRDSTDCLEELIIPDFKVKKYLTLNKKVEIEITPGVKGEFEYHCGMNMYHGRIIVK